MGMSKRNISIKIGIIDYGMGNIMSIKNALIHLDFDRINLISNPQDFKDTDLIIIPGVGAFSDAMRNLKKQSLLEPLNKFVLHKKKPALGICLGMQLLLDYSYEGEGAKGLGWLKGEVKRLEIDRSLSVPHMGWNNLKIKNDSSLFEGISNEDDFYFVHSYHANISQEYIIAECDYGGLFPAAIGLENILGFQFHPEKSQTKGLRLLSNSLTFLKQYA